MTPDEVVHALHSGDTEAVRAAANDDFRDDVSAHQLTQVWTAVSDQLGSLVSAGEAVVLHDIPLTFSSGQAHLQVTYDGDAISGLVLRPGPPTARFGE
jgi:hypothetical protein